ncbi:pre-mRNA-splicing factor SYF1 [Camarhynchus parvulus]|uniref:pre-mRNA-splicing factor SYF1 n=1 Tax=Geospiza parvula TaxID=87175 RepID=UPI0012380E43|nr:pre-mRNA-splicing factor SYF1 [Camarhynchus parvulus]
MAAAEAEMAAREEPPGAGTGAGPGPEQRPGAMQEPAAMEEPAPGAGPAGEAGPAAVVADPGAGPGPERPELCFEEEEVQHEEELSLGGGVQHGEELRGTTSRGVASHLGRHTGAPGYNYYRSGAAADLRALRELPGSYKLWYQYLRQRRAQVKGRCPSDPAFEEANAVHERALVFMHKMPRIWLDYCQFLAEQGRITRTRRTFDRALRALPITQHRRLWPPYLSFVRRHPLPETAVRVFRRFLKLCPEEAEQYVSYLRSVGRLDEAAQVLARLVNDERCVSRQGKSNYQLWQELCELLSQELGTAGGPRGHPGAHGDLGGHLGYLRAAWGPADSGGRAGNDGPINPVTPGFVPFQARDVYEEAVQTVMTPLDTQAQLGQGQDEEVELELRLARFERLMARRPLLLNSVLLRQNPHNVHEWHKRVALHQGQPDKIIQTFTEAVRTVDPQRATGRPHELWVAFARFYEDNGQLDDARSILSRTRATRVRFRRVEDLAAVWCEFGELELRHQRHQEALAVLRKATALPSRRAEYFDSSEPVQNRLYKNLRVWAMLADLEESLGTFQSTRSVYERILDLRIATPQIVINYALLLEEHGRFEDSFKAYERGIALFRWPHVGDLWLTYLSKFVARYGGRKLERARDLFEQALDGCPPQHAKNTWARLEGSLRRDSRGSAPEQGRFHIYRRRITGDATRRPHLPESHRGTRLAHLGTHLFGVTHTRPIYQRAIEVLGDDAARELCLRFADMECKLGEVDRARAIYTYCSQICDPRITGSFWQTWKEFEIRHGNEDTIREMLRIKRSVQATYNTQVNFMASQMLKVSGSATGTVSDLAPGQSGLDEMKLLEQRAEALAAEAQRDTPRPAQQVLFVR